MAKTNGSYLDAHEIGRYTAPNDPVLRARVAGDAFERLRIEADGTIVTGDGTSAPSTDLSSLSSASVQIASGITVVGSSAVPTTDANTVRPTGADVVLWMMAAATTPVNAIAGDIIWNSGDTFTTQVLAISPMREFAGKWPSGSYLPSEGTTTTSLLVNGTIRYTPIWVPEARTCNAITVEWTVAGSVGSLVRVGLFTPDANGRPGALLIDAGTLDGTQAAGAYDKACSQAVPRGLIWVGVVGQGAPATQPTMRVLQGYSRFTAYTVGTAGTSGSGFTESGMTGALTNATPATGSTSGGCAAKLKSA